MQNLFLEAFCMAHALDIVNYVDKCEGTVVWMDRVMGEFSQENIQCGQKNMVIREFTSEENSSIANLFISQNEPPWTLAGRNLTFSTFSYLLIYFASSLCFHFGVLFNFSVLQPSPEFRQISDIPRLFLGGGEE